MDLLAQGDLDGKIDPFHRRDEIGKISRALSVFQQKLLENRQLTAEQTRLQQRAEVDRRDTMLQVADRFEQEIGKVIQTVSTASAEIESAAGSLTKTAETTQELSYRGCRIPAVLCKCAVGRRRIRANGLFCRGNRSAGWRITKGR
jgi:methyl-accepting chemotaxis protein